ncbi:MAG: alpha/beta hydrolase [Agathobacter sp.]|nr:alpha/beta hydrolase [Agathobacter sp.]
MSLMSILFRKGAAKNDKKRDAGLTTPSDIKRFDDIHYGAKKEQVLDVYRPANEEGLLPVIVSVHGGGWVYGDKELYQWYCMNLAQRGFAVVNFTYRLAPKYKFPSGIEDTNMVFHWIWENAQIYGFDLRNLFAVGDSAGAHMLSVYAAMKCNPVYAAQFDFPVENNVEIRAVALNCGKYDLRGVIDSGDALQSGLMKDVLPKKGTKGELEWVSPINYVNEAFPPAFVMTSNGDFLRDEAPKMRDKLMSLGVECEYRDYGDESEKLNHVFHLNIRLQSAEKCNDEECDFFRTHTCQ